MAFLMDCKSEQEIQSLGVKAVKDYAKKLSETYGKIINGKYVYCHGCNEFHSSESFYNDKRYASGLYPICKKQLMIRATDYDKDKKIYVDNREKTIKVFQMLDIPFIDSVYQTALQNTQEAVGEKNRATAFQHALTIVKSLPQYKGMTFKDSEFDAEFTDDEEEINENSRIVKQAKKRFGKNYNTADLVFLENEYQDWIKRYTCDTKAQEILFKRICCKELEIDKAQKLGKDTKEMDKTLQDLMGSLQVRPNQSNSNALTEAKTFGQLIQRWEDEYDGGKPIPEPDEEFKDQDKIGLLIDVFYKGHLSKMMGLKNAFSSLYERFMSKYTVNKPQYDEDVDSEVLFDQIFGSKVDEE